MLHLLVLSSHVSSKVSLAFTELENRPGHLGFSFRLKKSAEMWKSEKLLALLHMHFQHVYGVVDKGRHGLNIGMGKLLFTTRRLPSHTLSPKAA